MGDFPGPKNFMNPAGRREWEPSEEQKKAQQRAKVAAECDAIESLISMGYSQRQMAIALNMSVTTIRERIQVIRTRRAVDNAATLTERLDITRLKHEHLYRQMMDVISRKGAYDKDRIAAAETCLKLLVAIDEIDGTRNPDKVNAAAVGEMFDVFSWIVDQANPEQQGLYLRLLQQKLGHSALGRQVGSLLQGAQQQAVIEGSIEEQQKQDVTEESVDQEAQEEYS